MSGDAAVILAMSPSLSLVKRQTEKRQTFFLSLFAFQVSALKCGFLSVSQESVLIGEVSYHDYYGILVDPEEREAIARNLGPVNKVRPAPGKTETINKKLFKTFLNCPVVHR